MTIFSAILELNYVYTMWSAPNPTRIENLSCWPSRSHTAAALGSSLIPIPAVLPAACPLGDSDTSFLRVWVLHLRLQKDSLSGLSLPRMKVLEYVLLAPCAHVFFFSQSSLQISEPLFSDVKLLETRGIYTYSISKGMDSVRYYLCKGVNSLPPDSEQQNHWDASVSCFAVVQCMTEIEQNNYQPP